MNSGVLDQNPSLPFDYKAFINFKEQLVSVCVLLALEDIVSIWNKNSYQCVNSELVQWLY